MQHCILTTTPMERPLISSIPNKRSRSKNKCLGNLLPCTGRLPAYCPLTWGNICYLWASFLPEKVPFSNFFLVFWVTLGLQWVPSSQLSACYMPDETPCYPGKTAGRHRKRIPLATTQPLTQRERAPDLLHPDSIWRRLPGPPRDALGAEDAASAPKVALSNINEPQRKGDSL